MSIRFKNLRKAKTEDCDSDCECENCVEVPPNKKRGIIFWFLK